MSFANPTAWGWAALALLVAAVYLLQLGRQEQPVATFGLWQRALARRPAWFRLRFWLSLATQVLLVLLLVAALAQPFWTSVEAARRNMVLVLDVSASMAAKDGEPTRWAQLQDQARQIIDDLQRGERLALVTAGSTSRIACRWTGDRQVLRDALDELAPTDGVSRVAEAVDVARTLLANQRNPRIWVLTDACFPEAQTLAQAADVQLIRVGQPADNVGITHLGVRPNPLDPADCELLVGVSNAGQKDATRTIEFGLQGGKLDRVELNVAAGDWAAHLARVPAGRGGMLAVRLQENDALASDNAAYAQLPARQRPLVRMATPGPAALEAALQANPRIVFQPAAGAKPARRPAAEGQTIVSVFVREVPQTLPPGPLLIIEPQNSCDAWTTDGTIRDAACAVQDTRGESLLLAGVGFDSYVVDEAVRLKFPGPTDGLVNLVTAASGDALYTAIERPTGRVLVLHANLEKSDLPQRADFPQLLDNAIRWLCPPVAADRSAGTTADASELPPAAADRKLIAPDQDATTLPAGQGFVLPDRVGVWNVAGETTGDTRGTLALAANLTDIEESDLRASEDLRGAQFVPSSAGLDQPLWVLLVAAAIVVLVLEWCLFHRRVVV